MRVMILGGNGQLGSDIARVLQDSHFDTKVFFRADLDLEKDPIFEKLSSLGHFDVVINCMSYHRVDECEEFGARSFQVNVTAVGEIAKYCRHQGATLFHFTTDYVFGDDHFGERLLLETDPVAPLSIYGLSKAAGEMIVRAYLPQHFIFRVASLFGIAGSSGKGGNFIETMIERARKGLPLRVVNDQVMSPTHTLDVARAVASFLRQEVRAFGTYHCVNTGACTWYEFTKTIFQETGIHADLQPTDMKSFVTQARRPRFSALDNHKILCYHKMPGWNSALREYLHMKGHCHKQNKKEVIMEIPS